MKLDRKVETDVRECLETITTSYGHVNQGFYWWIANLIGKLSEEEIEEYALEIKNQEEDEDDKEYVYDETKEKLLMWFNNYFKDGKAK